MVTIMMMTIRVVIVMKISHKAVFLTEEILMIIINSVVVMVKIIIITEYTVGINWSNTV